MNKLRCYLAAPYAFQNQIRKYAEELRSLGIEVTSRWLEDTAPLSCEITDISPAHSADWAYRDIQDIAESNIFILFTPSEEALEFCDISKKSWARGGRHTEMGFALGLRLLNGALSSMKTAQPQIIVCGRRENIFCFYDPVEQRDSWDTTLAYLLEIAHHGQDRNVASEA